MYIPKNRIKPNLFTAGNEYMLKSNSENYSGFYHTLWNGKIFTGKTQNSSNIRELILFVIPEEENPINDPENLIPSTIISIAKNHDPLVEKYPFNQQEVMTYLQSQKKDVMDDDLKKLPFQCYPIPTVDDYLLGSFTRYFAVKVNEIQYLELDYPLYKKLKKKNANWAWELYNCFSIQWTLTSNEVLGLTQESVARTNRNQVLIAERNNDRLGLQIFLKGQYLKFYK